MNAKKSQSLSPAHWQILMDAAREAAARNRKDVVEIANKAIQDLNGLGTQAYTPAADEHAQWASIREQVWNEIVAQEKGKVDLELAKKIAQP